MFFLIVFVSFRWVSLGIKLRLSHAQRAMPSASRECPDGLVLKFNSHFPISACTFVRESSPSALD